MRDDVSRNTAGKKETRTRNNSKKQILVWYTGKHLKKYKNEGVRFVFTTFIKSIPFFILSPGINSRNTCLCPKHNNIDFLHTPLLKCRIISGTRKQALENLCCDTNNYDCMYNISRQCKGSVGSDHRGAIKSGSTMVAMRKKRTYIRKERRGNNKDVKTMGTEKVINKGNINDLKHKYII